MRNDKRTNDTSRRVNIIPNFMPNAAGSCLIETGRTRVLCTATVSHTVPTFRPDNMGWLTAEYSMLPGSTVVRKARERLKSDSRSIEIQRLIGRSLRSIVDLSKLPGITITIDCDVIQADGGTRTASITGGFVAFGLAVKKLYTEDSSAEADMNYVGTEDGEIAELQITGEQRTIRGDEFVKLISLCQDGVIQLINEQKKILED